jgi:hypothetical protein
MIAYNYRASDSLYFQPLLDILSYNKPHSKSNHDTFAVSIISDHNAFKVCIQISLISYRPSVQQCHL